MNDNLTEILFVLDRSGSMARLREDAIGGFNTFLKDQKEQEGEANMSLVLFDHEYILVHDRVPVADIEGLDDNTYVPRGRTALLDAIGRTVNEVGTKLSAIDEAERPGKVICVILTDGLENASQEFSRDSIKTMIEQQAENYNWEFMYLGADAGAFAEASSIGVRSSNTAHVRPGSEGLRHSYQAVSRAVSSYRTSGTVSSSWRADDVDDADSITPSTTDSSSD